MRLGIKVVFLGLALLCIASVPAMANTLLSSNFAGAPNAFGTYFAGDTFADNWKVETGSIDWIGNYWQGPGGNGGSVDLDGLFMAGSISHELNVTYAGTYTLSFYVAGNPDGPPQFKLFDVHWFDQFHNDLLATGTLHDDGGSVRPNGMNYHHFTFDVTAPAGPGTLVFESLDQNDNAFGPVLGNVSVATPEPASLALLGSGLIGIGLRLRRKK